MTKRTLESPRLHESGCPEGPFAKREHMVPCDTKMTESLTNVRNNNEIRIVGAYPQVGGSGIFDKDITDLLGSSQYALRYELACGDLSLLYREKQTQNPAILVDTIYDGKFRIDV